MVSISEIQCVRATVKLQTLTSYINGFLSVVEAEEAKVPRQLSELKDRPDRNWNTEVKETLKKAGTIPQSLQK